MGDPVFFAVAVAVTLVAVIALFQVPKYADPPRFFWVTLVLPVAIFWFGWWFT